MPFRMDIHINWIGSESSLSDWAQYTIGRGRDHGVDCPVIDAHASKIYFVQCSKLCNKNWSFS